ncbi:MAG: LAGLIDADG family homing endonuclease [bacterium]|nr:LAGLIDADG family homing endonuclease [bacterium]
MAKKHFTSEDYTEWKRLYESGKTSYEIATLYDTTPSTIRRRLYVLGVKLRRPARRLQDGSNVTETLVNEWREVYELGQTSYEIASRYGVAASTVARNLAKEGVALDSSRQRQSFSDPFATMSPDTAWLLGLFYTDGNVYRNRARLASNDEDMLEKAQAILTPFGNHMKIIDNHQGKSQCRILQVSSIEFVEHLKRYGVIERKSLTIAWPTFLERTYWSHFMRGCFDGDGYIGISGKQFLMSYATGSVAFAEAIARVIGEAIGYQPNPWKHKKWNSYQVGLYSAKAARFGEWLYEGSEDKNRMKRKYERFVEITSIKKSDV